MCSGWSKIFILGSKASSTIDVTASEYIFKQTSPVVPKTVEEEW